MRIAGALLFDELHANLEQIRSEDLTAALPFLRRNRVPLAVLASARSLAAEMPNADFAVAVRSHQDEYQRQLNAYTEISRAWKASGIDGVLIKSPGYFPYTSSNVDVLVAEESAFAACESLTSLGYGEVHLAREPYKRLFRRLRDPHLGFAVHVHTSVGWINRFLTNAEVMRGRRIVDDAGLLTIPSSTNVAITTTAHWLYEDKELALRDLYHLDRAIIEGLDWRVVRTSASEHGWRPGLELAFGLYARAAERLGATGLAASIPEPQPHGYVARLATRRAVDVDEMPVLLSRVSCKTMHIAKSLQDPALSTPRSLADAARVVFYAVRVKLPRLRHGPFVTVAVSGPDGVGKSTLVEALDAKLRHEIGVSVRRHWMRPGSSRAVECIRAPLARLLELRASDAPEAGRTEPRKTLLPRHRSLRRGWSLVVLVDFLIRLWVSRIQCRLTGGIHVFDRHALDAAVDLESMYAFPAASWIRRLAPRPHVQFLLDARTSVTPVAGEVSALARHYERFAHRGDVRLRPYESLDVLVSQAAGVILSAYVHGGRVR